MTTDRTKLRDELAEVLDRELNHPWGPTTPSYLAYVLMPMIRQAQADAWLRGWAASKLDAHDKAYGGIVLRTNPYAGGRHVGLGKARVAPELPSWRLP